MTITTSSVAHQMFSGTAVDTVIFARSISQLLLTTSGTVGLSFDGTTFMSITAGTHMFNYVWAKTLYFNGSGTWSGCGISV